MKNLRQENILFWGVALIGFLLLCLSLLFAGNIERKMREESTDTIMELALKSSLLLSRDLNAKLDRLRLAARFLSLDSHFLAEELGKLRILVGALDTAYVDMRQLMKKNAAVQATQEYVSNLHYGENGVRQIRLQVPVHREGKQVGVLYADYRQDGLYDAYGLTFYGGEGFSFVINDDGQIIFSPVSNRAKRTFVSVLDILRHENASEKVMAFARLLRERKSGIANLDFNGIRQFIAVTPVEGRNWHTIVLIPQEAMHRRSHQIVMRSLTLSGLMAVGVGLFVFYISRIRQRHTRELLEIAWTDKITGGWNSGKFREELKQLLSRKHRPPLGIFKFDVRHFKYVNNAYGYPAGDAVLRHLADVLRKYCGEGGIWCRDGADTFMLAYPCGSEEKAAIRCEALQAEMSNISDIIASCQPLIIFCGIFFLGSKEDIDTGEAVDRAGMALKQAQKSHCYTHEFYSEELYRQLRDEQVIEANMHAALRTGEFIPYLQPQFGVHSQKIMSAEALVRWNSPHQGLIPPGVFIPLFERNGFIPKVDIYIFRQVCALLRKWIDEGRQPIGISVNISRAHLFHDAFPENYMAIKEMYRIPDNLLEIELTESMMFENHVKIQRVLSILRDNGFRCALDDFGAGHSSLNLLKDMPFDTLKIDQIFFGNTLYSKRRETIIRSIIDMADRLSMQTVSEGVETEEQLEFLRSTSCNLLQGYLLARPMSVSDFEQDFLPQPGL